MVNAIIYNIEISSVSLLSNIEHHRVFIFTPKLCRIGPLQRGISNRRILVTMGERYRPGS